MKCYSQSLSLLILLTIIPMWVWSVEVIDPNQLNRKGIRSEKLGQYEKAVDYFREALSVEPEQPMLQQNLFNALNNYSIQSASRGNVQAAIEACNEALWLRPLDITVASNLAIFFHNQALQHIKNDNLDAAATAIDDSQKVIQRFQLDNLAPQVRETHARIYLLLGKKAFDRQDIPTALENYRKCIEINPDEAFAYVDRSRIFWEMESFQEAISDLEIVAKLRGESAALLQLIGRLKVEAKGKGIDLSKTDNLFVMHSSAEGTIGEQDQQVQTILKEIRLQILQSLTIASKTPLAVDAEANDPFLPVREWLQRPEGTIEKNTISLGLAETELSSPDLRQALLFQYLIALLRQLGDDSIPYWFVVGLAQVETFNEPVMNREEEETLIREGENFALFVHSDLTFPKMGQMTEAKRVQVANLESKALYLQLIKMIRREGLRTLLANILKGMSFEESLLAVGNLTSADVEKEWRVSLGIAPS